MNLIAATGTFPLVRLVSMRRQDTRLLSKAGRSQGQNVELVGSGLSRVRRVVSVRACH